jgi:hypothetical protein
MKKRSVLSQFLFFFFFFATFDDFCGEQLPSFIITHPHPSLSLETVSQFIAARKIAQRTKIICQVMESI